MSKPALIDFVAGKVGLTDQGIARARDEARRSRTSVERAAVTLGLATGEAVYRAVAEYAGVPYVKLSDITIDQSIIDRVPAKFVTHYEFMPIEESNGTLVVALTEPLDTHLIDELRLMLRQTIGTVVATPAEISSASKHYYGIGADTVEQMMIEAESEPAGTVNLDSHAGEMLDDSNVDASIIKFVNELLQEAIASEATDVHIEPFESELRVRYRIDGVLHRASVPPNILDFHSSIVSRIKILANLNIAEHRLPQDGKIEATLGGDAYDLRVSILPTPHGETVNIRVLSRKNMFLSLTDLGLSGDQFSLFETLIARPHGVILVTGPTGSGKTTTLYACLQKINSHSSKIITIEDPIEYQLHGITQMQVLDKIGFSFARGLRSMLRHDPDIMMVGEIRDSETAETAIRCALTGHLVLSTLHTNDAPSAVTRLIDMGIEPFLLASSIIAAVAQRLVRIICPQCRVEYIPDDEALREIGVTADDARGHTFYRGTGCESCRFTGYKGRTAIYEILPFTGPIRELAMQRAPSSKIKEAGVRLGMRTLRQDGWLRIVEGVTTFEEVLRVAQAEEGLELLADGHNSDA